MSGQVFAVASGKGGVGKTTTVVNLGVTLRADDHSVALVDADLGMPNLATFFGLDPDPTIHELLAGTASLEEVVIEEADGFAVVPGSRDLASFARADPTGLGEVVEALAADYEFVLIDTGAGLSYEDVLPLGLVDGIILVSSPDPAALGDTRRTAAIADMIDDAPRGLVVTHATESTDPSAIADELGADLLGVIPEDPTVRESTAGGRPLEAYDPGCPAAEAYRRLADSFAEIDVSPSATRAPDGSGDADESDEVDESDGAASGAEDANAEPPAEESDGEDEGDPGVGGETPSEAEADPWPVGEGSGGGADDGAGSTADAGSEPGDSPGVSSLVETLGRGDEMAESSGGDAGDDRPGDGPDAPSPENERDEDDYTAGIWGDDSESAADGRPDDAGDGGADEVDPTVDDGGGGFLTRLKRRFV